MNQSIHRLATFVDWPPTARVSCLLLARTGFVYTGSSDRVRCYLCLVEIDGWQNGDDPVLRHQQVRPDCPVALGTDCLNDTAAEPEVSGRESPLSADDAIVPQAPPSDFRRRYRTFPARLATLEDWPKPDVVRAVDLARAGFWYTKKDDEVKCSFCQTAVRDWKLGNVPTDEHRKLAPSCHFVRANFCRSDLTTTISRHSVRLQSLDWSQTFYAQLRYTTQASIFIRPIN